MGKHCLNFRLVEYSWLPASSRDLIERSEVQVFELNPIGSDSPLCVFWSDGLCLQFLQGINIQLGPVEHRDKPQ